MDTKQHTYLDYYNHVILPKLAEIDIAMKAGDDLSDVKKTAKLLDISEQELLGLMKKRNITHITKGNFFQIMTLCDSPVCLCFKRMLERGIPDTYSPFDISYIYDIDIDEVLTQCGKIGISQFTSDNLTILFSQISLNFY